jgi:hypothetical protein
MANNDLRAAASPALGGWGTMKNGYITKDRILDTAHEVLSELRTGDAEFACAEFHRLVEAQVFSAYFPTPGHTRFDIPRERVDEMLAALPHHFFWADAEPFCEAMRRRLLR